MALRITGSVIGEPITSSSSSATGMWLSQEVAALQQDGIWQIAPGFTLTSSAATVNEGASITITLTTTGILNGTAIPYVISGANIFANDSANGVITGNFVIQNNSNTISFAANADLLTEGSEAFTITAGGASTSVTINDTSLTPVSADAQFPYTTLALHGNGTNNAQNNTFLDSSTNNFSITRNGNSTQGAFSPYGGNWSTSFSDSAGDYLEISSSTAFALGTGDFTIEAWIYPFSYGGSVAGTAIFGTTAGSGTGYSLNLGESQDRMRILSNASGTWADNLVVSAGGGAPLHTWSHIAWVRSGNSMTIYKNGVSVATMSGVSGYNFTSPGNKGFIGFWWDGGTTRYFNGYISNLRVVKGTALYTTTFTPSTTPLTAVANTSLLTCQDNRFIDESPNNFTITRYIAPKIQKFNPFSPVITTPTTYSGYFSASQQLTSASIGTSIGTGDFSMECWVNVPNAANGYAAAIQLNVSTGYNLYIQTHFNTLRVLDYNNPSGSNFELSGGTINNNTWYHLLLTRQSGTIRGFINGNLTVNQTGVTTTYGTAGTCQINAGLFASTISNARVVIGNVPTVYQTSSTTNGTQIFTPSTTPLTAISGTSFLTCQSPTFIDNSINAFPITATGSPTPITANPFGVTNTSSEYSTSTFGGSAYFDGSGDYLEAASNAAFALPGDFTYECWFNSDNTGTGSMFMEVPVNNGLQLYYNGSQLFVSAYAITSLISYTYTMPISTWVHIALVRKGTASNNVVLYINGISVATASYNSEFPQGPFRIGGTSYYFKGYISNCRLVKGTAVYQSNFAPPVAPVTAVANTQLLCNFTNAGIIDNAMMTTLETVADAKISTTQSKFGGTSISFDGTGDYLAYTGGTSLNFGTGDFTIELWVYLANNGNFNPFIRPDASGSFVEFGHDFETGQLKFQARDGAIVAVTTTMPTNQWTHVAACRSGTSLRLFINGTQVGSTTTNSTNFGLPTGTIRIGGSSFSGSHVISGYLDDLRVTRGYARYTSNFTPPTEFANK